MAAATSVSVQLNGQDKTKAAFDSVAKRAKDSSNKIGAALKAGAIAVAVGAVVKKVADALDGLNKLNDIAQQAGMKAEWLQRFVGTMGQAGINITTEGLVASVQKLNAALVNTEKLKAFEKIGVDVSHLKGLRPEEAFTGFLETVAAIPDEQTRLLALQRGLEEQGLRLAPLLRQGPDNFRASLEAVMGVIPAASEQTVGLATNANNAFALVGQSFQTIWYEALGSVLTWADQSYGGVDKAIMRTWEYTKAYTLSLVRATQQWGENVGGVIALFQFDFVDALEVLTYRIAQWGYILMRPFAKLAAMLGADGLLNAIELVDAEIQRRIERIYKSHGFEPTTTLAEKIGQDFLRAQQNIEKWDVALDAKKNLSAFASEGLAQIPALTVPEIPAPSPAAIEPLAATVEESVTTAVSSGVQQGLAEGVDSNSYDVIKNAFKASALTASVPTIAASIAAATAPSAPGSTSPTGGGLAEAVEILRKIFDAADKSQKTLATLGAF